MKNFKLYVGAVFIVGAMVGCNHDQPTYNQRNLIETSKGAFLVGNWQAQGESPSTVSFSVSKDGKYTEEINKDVGTKNDKDVPAPSVCHYRQSGTISLMPATRSLRAFYRKSNKKLVPHFVINTRITKAELIEDASNSQNCPTFVTKQNKAKTQLFNRTITKQDDNNVSDTWSETKFVKVNN